MKPSLFAFLFLFASITSSVVAVLVDSNGFPIENGGTYYIGPHINILGGGFVVGMTGNETCPVSVVQTSTHHQITDRGLPWRITSPARIRFLKTNMDVGFFAVEGKVPDCVPTRSGWTIVEGEDGEKSVKIGGVYENTVKGTFRIQLLSYWARSYTIEFCPTNGDSCSTLGFSSSGRRLVVTDEYPLGLIFWKAESFESEISQVVDN